MGVRIPEELKDNIIYPGIWQSLHRYNQNYLGIYCGRQGSGKTYAVLRMAKDLDPTFDVDRIVFTAQQFMEIVGSKLKRGSFILFDDAGLGINSRLFYEQANMAVSYVTQSFRFLHLGVAFTVPAFNYIDKQSRQMFHYYIEMKKAYPDQGFSWGKWKKINYDPMYGDIRTPFLRGSFARGKHNVPLSSKVLRVVYKKIFFAPPDKELAREYEIKKDIEMSALYEKYNELLKAESEHLGNKAKMQEVYHKILPNWVDYWDESKERFDAEKICLDYKIGRSSAYSIARMLKTHIKGGVAG